MTWLRWFGVGKQVLDLALELLTGQVATFSFVVKGITYTVTVKRG